MCAYGFEIVDLNVKGKKNQNNILRKKPRELESALKGIDEKYKFANYHVALMDGRTDTLRQFAIIDF